MKKTAIVNIYNFIRMSHSEPSRFVEDDFETLRKELILIKQFGFPGTYALKYDALMDERYQTLLKEYLDENDEVSIWWEISEPLCQLAGVSFHREKAGIRYDDRVNSAYSLGYEPWERKKLVDAYMEAFHKVFGRYPKTIGAWVIDSVTVAYAVERYGVVGAAMCRDQMDTDGFTLWGSFPNGFYYPSKKNAFIPAQTKDAQINAPMIRLLGPDPIYNFETSVREGMNTVYTAETVWQTGRDLKWLSWFFGCLTDEDVLGVGYAQLGQENNFLWENIEPGLETQLIILKELEKAGKLRVETMEQSSKWFQDQYEMTPPLTFQASQDWNVKNNVSVQWYACANYRVGFLGEEGHLRIRDMFLYDEKYPCRYLEEPLRGPKSKFDALPVMFPQIWGNIENRPFIRLFNQEKEEPTGIIRYEAVDEFTAKAKLIEDGVVTAEFTMMQDKMELQTKYKVLFDCLPVFQKLENNTIYMKYEDFLYDFTVEQGQIEACGSAGVEITPCNGKISFVLGKKLDKIRRDIEVPFPKMKEGKKHLLPPMMPKASLESSVFSVGTSHEVVLTARGEGEIRYTLDGTEPTNESSLYKEAIRIEKDTVLLAKVFLEDGRASETAKYTYQFALKDMVLESPVTFDKREALGGNGVKDLLQNARGSLDYFDGKWRATLDNLEVTGELSSKIMITSIGIGFLTNHRCGIIYPEYVELYTGEDKEHLTLSKVIQMPKGLQEREIMKKDAVFEVKETIGAFRIVAHRYELMPSWCFYRGVPNVFTFADNVIVVPE